MRTVAVFLLAACTAPLGSTSAEIDMAQPWPRHEIFRGTLAGADGVHLGDIDGDGLVDVTAPFEQSSHPSISLHPPIGADPALDWPTIVPSCTLNAIEDSKFADVGHNGRLGLIVAGDAGEKISIVLQPDDPAQFWTPSAWQCVTLTASNTAPAKENWLQVAFADVDGDGVPDIVVGGRTTGAGAGYLQGRIGYFTNPTGAWRSASAYVWHEIGLVGVTWSLVPIDVDGDGDLDLFVTDGGPTGNGGTNLSLMGSRVLINPLAEGGGTWESRMIHPYKGAEQLAHFGRITAPDRVIDGSSRDTGTSYVEIHTTTDAWRTVSSTTSVPWPNPPGGVGHYVDVLEDDVDVDGLPDLVFTCHHADSDPTRDPEDVTGVFWLRNNGDGTWTYGEISGPQGVKYDNVERADVNGDGLDDLIADEQGIAGVTPNVEKEGVVWFEHPGASP